MMRDSKKFATNVVSVKLKLKKTSKGCKSFARKMLKIDRSKKKHAK